MSHMRIKTADLAAGDVMGSGEIVLSVLKTGLARKADMRTKAIYVTLKDIKRNIIRICSWSAKGTVTIKERKCELPC